MSYHWVHQKNIARIADEDTKTRTMTATQKV